MIKRILKVKDWLERKKTFESDLLSDIDYLTKNKTSLIVTAFIKNLKLPSHIRRTATELQEEIDRFIKYKKNNK